MKNALRFSLKGVAWEIRVNYPGTYVLMSRKRVWIEPPPTSVPGAAVAGATALFELPFRWYLKVEQDGEQGLVEMGLLPTGVGVSSKMEREIRESMGVTEGQPLQDFDVLDYGCRVPAAYLSFRGEDEEGISPAVKAAIRDVEELFASRFGKKCNGASGACVLGSRINLLGQDGWSLLYEDTRTFCARTLSPPPRASTRTDGVFRMKHSDIRACPFYILDPGHYREDGTCKCNDEWHQKMMCRCWGYKPKHFKQLERRANVQTG